MSVRTHPFGTLPDGTSVDIFTLVNEHGLEARLMTYGAILVSLKVPDRVGHVDDIVLGYDSLDGYLRHNPYFGCIAGRYANRIAKGRFTLQGVTYQLRTNDGPNHLHGGVRGFDKVVWNAEPVQQAGATGVRFRYLSKAGEEGYPGNLSATVSYWLTNKDELRLEYEAVTDQATVVNLTNHSYWCLVGQGARDVLAHELTLEADKYTVVDAEMIPTGELRDVRGTPMDFTKPHTIGERMAQVRGGYDHNYVLRRSGRAMALAAHVYEPTTGRVMDITTSEPGIQFYSGNFLDGTIVGKGGRVYRKHYGFCLETQHFPDSPNHPQFPSTVLEPGQVYRTSTVHSFSTARTDAR